MRDGDGRLMKQWDDKYVFEGSDIRATDLLAPNPPDDIRPNLFVMDIEATNTRIIMQMALPSTSYGRVNSLMFV